MRTDRLSLRVHKPCTQSWTGMLPDAAGRHCAHCDQTVTDFTGMTDSAVLAHIRQFGFGCGRFDQSQLERQLIAPATRQPSWWRRAAIGAMLLFAARQESSAQSADGTGIRYEQCDFETPVVKAWDYDLVRAAQTPVVPKPVVIIPPPARHPDVIILGGFGPSESSIATVARQRVQGCIGPMAAWIKRKLKMMAREPNMVMKTDPLTFPDHLEKNK